MTATLARLAPLPRAIRTLTDEEAQHLASAYPDLPPSPAQCPTCRGRKTFRWYAYDSTGRTDQVTDYECSCNDQWMLNRYLSHSGVGRNYQWYDWDDYVAQKPSEVIDWLFNADAYIRGGFGFVLTGAMGNGKSLLANLAFKSLLAQGYDGYFTTIGSMVDLATASWRSRDDRAWFTRRIRNAGVLVIDDLGREAPIPRVRTRGEVALGIEPEVYESHSFMKTIFEEMIRYRVAQAKPVIITTNVAMDELGERYTTNVFSLLSERSEVIRFSGEDYRPVAKQIFVDEVRRGLTRPVVLA